MKLLLDKIKLALQKRSGVTKNRKCYEAWAAKGYQHHPEVSVIIQSHNKSLQVAHIVPKLRQYPSVEIIVIDDGSSEAHTRRLTRLLTGSNEFLVRANDLYEVTTYDRTIRMANGDYIALLQDDDDFDSLEWMHQAVALFRSHPTLAILGGHGARAVVFDDATKRAFGGDCDYTDEFCYVPTVNRAPMWIQKQLFDTHLHHIDPLFAPFQFDDYELCLRAWRCGLQVGRYNAHFHSLSVGGMRLWNSHFTEQQTLRNGERLYQLYHDCQEEIAARMKEAKE
jgi:glycosyltransferase involved in cell wall biosynthesis